MKRIIGLICVSMIMLSMVHTAFAGSIPEDLLHYDGAEIFFAQVMDIYHPEGDEPYVEVLPWKVIKGDVNMNPQQRVVYLNPNTVGDFKLKKGENYLFTYFDENNTTDIFQVTSYDPYTLKLKNVTGDMWKRFEKYLNEGRYLDAEHERIDRKNTEIPVSGSEISLEELIGVSEENAETVSIHYYGTVYEVEPKEFYKAIDGIMLTDIEDVSLERRNGDTFSMPNGMYITVNGFDGYAFVTSDCKVDKYGMHYSRLPIGAFTMKTADYAKLKQFVTEKDALPFIETPLAGEMFRWVILAIMVFMVAFVIGFMVKRKR